MKYKVEWKRKAVKQLTKVQQQQQGKILDAVTKLENSETWGDVKKLVNHDYGYRLRVGDYRILFYLMQQTTRQLK